MKNVFLTVLMVVAFLFETSAQAPEGFKYQAVVRDAANTILNNQAIGLQMTIMQGMIGGPVVYRETFAATTNTYGLVNLEIGSGIVVSGNFANIDWSNGPYYMETALDASGGTNYVVFGTSQLLSVPYALHSKMAENVVNDQVDDADADATNELNSSVTLNGTNLEITDAGGTIVTDLSSLSNSSGNWTLTGNHLHNSNAGNVGVGSTTPVHLLEVGSTDTNSIIAVGHIGNFNEPYSGELIFAEDLDYNGLCGLKFQMNGSTNNLHLIGGCSTPDTIARFNRSGFSNMKTLRVGNNILSNSGSALTVDGDIQVNGNVNITGNIAKGGGTFKVDHPLDPANKYLIHSFVESPEMMNIHSGNITTDENGYATVNLPAYFQAANKDFRYQLTVIGTFAQAIVKEKIHQNKFLIQTNEPNVEVSWSVTSVRADKYAEKYPIQPEVEKEIKGSYIHPELYGAGEEKSEQVMKGNAIKNQSNSSKSSADQQ